MNFIVHAPESFYDVAAARLWWERCSHDWLDFERCAFWYIGQGVSYKDRPGLLAHTDESERGDVWRLMRSRGWTVDMLETVSLWAKGCGFKLSKCCPPAGFGLVKPRRGDMPPPWDPPVGIGRAIPESGPATPEQSRAWFDKIYAILGVDVSR